MFQQDIGIDLGTSTVLIYVRGRGIVLREPSVVALDRSTGELLAVGASAQKMIGRTPEGIAALRPIRNGVVNDADMTEKMLRYYLKRIHAYGMFRPNLLFSVPSDVTEVEEKAIIDAGMRAGAQKVYLIECPIAAAVGAGLPIDKPHGSMVIDIGGGSTNIAVLSMGTIIGSASVRVGGDQYNEALIRYIREKHSVLIGDRTAEEIKVNVGCVYPRPEEKVIEVHGRCLLTGLPRTVSMSSNETIVATEEVTKTILNAIHGVLEHIEPELVADIADSGAILTGGGCLLWGFDKMLLERTGLPSHIADDAASCVVYGTGKALNNLSHMKDGVINLSRRRTLEEEPDE